MHRLQLRLAGSRSDRGRWIQCDPVDPVDPNLGKTVAVWTLRAIERLMKVFRVSEAELAGQMRRFRCKFSGSSMFELKQRLVRRQRSSEITDLDRVKRKNCLSR